MTQFERMIGALGVEPRPPDVIDRLLAYGDRLRDTAAPRGLIGRSTVANLDVVHLADSLAAVPLIESHIPGGSGRLVDVGSGAGLPGLPIAIALPDLAVVLLESSSRRQVFLKETIEALGIANARVAHARAEDAGRDPRYRERYDLAVSRAVLPTSPALELCLPLVRIGGLSVLYKTADQAAVLAQSDRAAAALGACAGATVEYGLPDLRQNRILAVYEKVSPTPSRYPRRSGVPAKRPL
ncbi:MAG: 16S rRNA (guanine(527)-N(7))-methyltransferase RsmG [Chloroflexi bacterium]|nr:16S rRNA (guanine(527)-N(7))-methyltransferase RsmG [Chloroflexota bacterium]MCY3938951.1 16S rRNA (guanine(527)-N(7))-methyltransferase RsmG [Chloroflexota bacterium]